MFSTHLFHMNNSIENAIYDILYFCIQNDDIKRNQLLYASKFKVLFISQDGVLDRST